MNNKPQCEVLLTTAIVVRAAANEDGASSKMQRIATALRTAVDAACADMPEASPVGVIAFDWLEPSSENNCGRCTGCKRWVTNRDVPDRLQGLPEATIVNGSLVCDQCRCSA